MIEVPDVRYITTTTAQQMISSSGLTIKGNSIKGLVIAQNPAPGTRISQGAPVTVTVAIEDGQDSIVIPDLNGMSNREIKQYANSLQIETIIHGTGYVVRQKPSPNQILDGHKLELWMENRWH
jgi:beta-lactam-binding protein with PASTA domain